MTALRLNQYKTNYRYTEEYSVIRDRYVKRTITLEAQAS